jgi:fucose 4-O-acetylase-like acetyltransferase
MRLHLTLGKGNVRYGKLEAPTPVIVPLNPSRTGITVYGGIGNCLIHPVFMTAESTNKEDFVKFIKKNCLIILTLDRETFFVLDNHRAHHSKIAKHPYTKLLMLIQVNRDFWAILKPNFTEILFPLIETTTNK